jgi:hypothetical protein
MHARVVRFDDVNADQLERVLAMVREADGPPPGVNATRLQVLVDPEQGTAVVLQYFETLDDMVAAAAIFEAMDASETPGRRVSVDACEVRLDRAASG